ncbi:MAG: cyclic nucleotide-binding domain-containing protein [Betaproteobacteria bacterium]|nr:cyclic nucleotide-binding domain-containing protein [Betaproteobacteria bacterium]
MYSHIGKYEVKKLLGKGATGSVYLASDAFASRDVAIKVMDAMPNDPEEARRVLKFFQNEASLAGKLRHPHIVSIFDAGVDKKDGKDLLYLVMELVEGTSLQPYCVPSDLLPASRSTQIAYKCCKALEYANSAGVVHRDIKPANIMLQPDYDIKVADFGAAQLARSDTTQVAGVGSPAYMSPEQIRGGEEIDFRSDMFSLGGVMYHMLTGQRPFGGSTAYELMDEILSKDPPPPSAVSEGVSAALDSVVLRALGKSRDDRFRTWNDFAAAIEPLLSEEDATMSSLSDAEEFSAMRRLAFFKRFSDTEVWEVVRACRCRKIGAGADLIREGVEDDQIYVLAAGMLKVTQRGKLLNAVSPGESVSEMVYARRSCAPRSATVTAMETSWVLGLRIQDIDGFSDSCRARFSEVFLSVMADRLSMLGGRLVSLMQEKNVGIV